MTTFLNAADLASYLGVPESGALTKIVELTNNLVSETWADEGEVETPPAYVTTIAWNVAIRAGSNPKGLSSWTRKWDDITRTERQEGGGDQFGVYLTDDELAQLGGGHDVVPAAKSIRLSVPRWGGSTRRWGC